MLIFNCKTRNRNNVKLKKEFEDIKGVDILVKSEDRQDHGQQKETKYKYRTINTALKTKFSVT